MPLKKSMGPARAYFRPGMRLRSRGAGRGLARGKGRGPMGVPFRAKGKEALVRSIVSGLGQEAQQNAFAKAGKMLKIMGIVGGVLIVGAGLWIWSRRG